MASALTPALTVTSRTTIRRRRDLPIAGKILVREGDVVRGDSIVAQAQLEGELRLVRVADTLGVPPAAIASIARVKEGEQVLEGALLAEVKGLWGLFRSSVMSPISGSVEFISSTTGHIGIRAAPQPLNLSAYMAGTVVSVEPHRSVVIEAEATLVQGIFGVGGERLGTIRMLALPSDARIEEGDIPSDTAGLILVGGCSPTIGAIRKAARGGAVGFITGSIDDRALREYVGYDIGVALTGDEDIPMTLVITEGFGSLPMSTRVIEALRKVEGSSASLNGATQVRAGAQRPEIIAPAVLLAVGESRANNELMVGARIRIIRVPYFGLNGIISDLPHDLVQIETGAALRVLRARLDDGREVTVPRANIELI